MRQILAAVDGLKRLYIEYLGFKKKNKTYSDNMFVFFKETKIPELSLHIPL